MRLRLRLCQLRRLRGVRGSGEIAGKGITAPVKTTTGAQRGDGYVRTAIHTQYGAYWNKEVLLLLPKVAMAATSVWIIASSCGICVGCKERLTITSQAPEEENQGLVPKLHTGSVHIELTGNQLFHHQCLQINLISSFLILAVWS